MRKPDPKLLADAEFTLARAAQAAAAYPTDEAREARETWHTMKETLGARVEVPTLVGAGIGGGLHDQADYGP